MAVDKIRRRGLTLPFTPEQYKALEAEAARRKTSITKLVMGLVEPKLAKLMPTPSPATSPKRIVRPPQAKSKFNAPPTPDRYADLGMGTLPDKFYRQ